MDTLHIRIYNDCIYARSDSEQRSASHKFSIQYMSSGAPLWPQGPKQLLCLHFGRASPARMSFTVWNCPHSQHLLVHFFYVAVQIIIFYASGTKKSYTISNFWGTIWVMEPSNLNFFQKFAGFCLLATKSIIMHHLTDMKDHELGWGISLDHCAISHLCYFLH